MNRRCWIGVFVLSGLALPASGQIKNPDGAKVLLLSGGQRQHHGYRKQAYFLQRALEETGKFEVTICEDAAILESAALAKYDLIVGNADRRDPEFKLSEKQQRALCEFVRGGKALVSIHGFDNAAKDWTGEMKEMLGGVFSHFGLPDGKVRQGQYRVKIVVSDHPITRGISDFDLADELYYHMQMLSEVRPLATVAHDGQDWPVAWAWQYGKGRVFHTPLGHVGSRPDSKDPIQESPSLLRLVLQGTEWAARK